MAQNIQLKRSSLPGKVPDTGSLNLGEIAINTYDGKVFLKKSGSIESVESIVTTNSINTGSITLTKTGSFGELVVTQDVNIQRDLYVVNDIIGNGDIDVLGNITGSNLLIKGTLTAQSYIVSSSVVNMTTQFASGSTIFGNTSDDTHQFTGSVNITGSGFINSNRIITSADTSSFATSGGYPASGVDYDTDTVTVVDFNNESPQFLIDYLYEIPVGTEVGLKGFLGNTSGSTLVVPANDYIAFVIDDAEVARVTVDGFQGVSLPAGLITGSSQLTSSYDTRYVISGSITQTTWDNIASKPGGIISSSTQLNNASIENLTITNLTTINETASVIYSSGSNRFGDFGNDAHQFTGSVQMSGSLNVIGGLTGSIAATNGVVSGSSQLTSSYDARYVISGSITQTTWDNIASKPSGIVSGSSQVTASLDTRYALSGSSGAVLDSRSRYLSQSSAATTWSFTHNIGSDYPMVTVYGSNNEIIQPEYVKTLSSNQTEIGFGTPVSGVAVASLGSLTEVTGRTIRQDFTSSISWSFVHNVGDKYVMVQAFDTADQMILPAEIRLASTTSSILTFTEPVSGYALATIGGDLPSISSSYEGYTLQVQGGSAVWASIVSASVSNAVSSSYVLYSNVANKPTLVSGSSQLTSSYDTRYVISGSITQTTWDNIASKPSGIVSGSSQVVSILDSLNTYTASVSSASLVTSIANLTSKTGSYATTGSNTFRGTQTMSGSIIPAIDNVYDLGSATYQWRDIYVSSGSLYIDGTKVLGSTGNELQITTDVGQSIKILEAGSDSIILQSADGNIELKSSGGGNLLFDPTNGLIDVRGTFQIQDGYKVTSSGASVIQFGNDLGITGSINTTGNINGLNLSTFSSSIASTLLNQNTATSSYETKGRGIVSSSYQITSWLPTGTISGSSQITYTSISSIPGGIVSGSSQVTTLLPTGTVSGSSQIVGILGALNTFSASASSSLGDIQNYTSSLRAAFTASGANVTFSGNVTIPGNLTITGTQTIVNSTTIQLGDNIIELNGNGVANGGLLVKDPTAPNTVSGSLLWDSTNDYWKAGALGAESKLLRAEGDSIVSGSSQINFTQLSGISNGIVSGSTQTIANLPTGTVSGSSQINFTQLSGISNGIVSGSTQTIANLPTGTVSGSSQIVSILSSLNTYTGSNDTTNTGQNTRLTTIESVTGSYETKGRGIVSGSSQITYANISSIPGGIVSGSSQITFSGISSKPTTISGYGITDALNNAATSEQTIGFRYGQINNSDKTIKFDPRWNESTYDADLGTLHIYSTTAAGVNYGRAGIALYNGSAYQYLTTKASTTGLFVNNSLIATAGSSPTFANVKGSSYFDAQASSGFRIRNSDDTVNAGGFTRRGLWEGNANYDPGMWAETGYGLYFYSNGSGAARAYFDTSGHFVPGANNTYNLGSASFRWANLYTNDLHLSNEGKVGGNEVDGTTGNWTIQEGEEHLYIINNKTGKKFKFSLEEIQ